MWSAEEERDTDKEERTDLFETRPGVGPEDGEVCNYR